MKSNMQLLQAISEMEPLHFVGLAKLLGVQLHEPAADNERQTTPRPFSDVLKDVMEKYDHLNRARKREIYKLVKQAKSTHRGIADASTTENS